MKFLLVTLIMILSADCSVGQELKLSGNAWVKRLSDPKDIHNESYQFLSDSVINKTDTSIVNVFLKQLEANGSSNNIYFTTRLHIFKAAFLQYQDYLHFDRASKLTVLNLMKQAMQQANESNDEYLIAFVSKLYFCLRNPFEFCSL